MSRLGVSSGEAAMNLFGLTIGKEKPMPFPQFRDHVRLSVRRAVPSAKLDPRDFGFVLIQEGRAPTTCNLRSLYLEYTRLPSDRDMMIQRWISSLTMEIPDHSWGEAQMTLRPTLKNADYVTHALRQMQKNTPPDSLSSSPFAGELSVIVMRELPGTVVAVTKSTLDSWEVTFEQAMQQALNNMNMQPFPTVTNSLVVAAATRKDSANEEVGLVFEGDHLTATWIVDARFRDYLTQRLQGDFVAFVPARNRLTVIRADEPGLIAQIQTNNRNSTGQAHWLTHQGLHVSGATTGGFVTVHKAGVNTDSTSLDMHGQFAGNAQAVPLGTPTGPRRKPAMVDFSTWGGLAESTEDTPPPRGR